MTKRTWLVIGVLAVVVGAWWWHRKTKAKAAAAPQPIVPSPTIAEQAGF